MISRLIFLFFLVVQTENEKLKHAQAGPSLGRELAVLLTEVQDRMRQEAERKAGERSLTSAGMEELLSLMHQNIRLSASHGKKSCVLLLLLLTLFYSPVYRSTSQTTRGTLSSRGTVLS